MSDRGECPVKKQKEMNVVVVVLYTRVEFAPLLPSAQTLRCVHSRFQAVG